MRPTPSPAHDVIVLGTGMAGTTIAAVLARHGADVLMLERHAHPRFAIGESMLPQSALWMWMLARRFDVEQIGHLSHLDAIMAHVSPRSGLKRTFGFAYHHDGHTVDPAQTHKLIPPDLPFVQEAHLLREDSDLYLLNTAIQHGAVAARDPLRAARRPACARGRGPSSPTSTACHRSATTPARATPRPASASRSTWTGSRSTTCLRTRSSRRSSRGSPPSPATSATRHRPGRSSRPAASSTRRAGPPVRGSSCCPTRPGSWTRCTPKAWSAPWRACTRWR